MRGDTGKCERCTAKAPQMQAQWQAEKHKRLDRSVRRSAPVVPGLCMACLKPLGGRSPLEHEKYCELKPFSCPCTRTFWTLDELRQHRNRTHH